MFAWLGCIFQGLATREGPIANWQAPSRTSRQRPPNAASGFSY